MPRPPRDVELGAAPRPVAGVRHTRLFERHDEQTQVQLAQQDEVLDTLHGSVRRLKTMGGQINDELAAHKGLLEALEEGVDKSSDMMASMKAKMQKLVPEGKQLRKELCANAFLSMLLLLLMSVVFN